ncbi:MAG: hypothetical protein U1F48_07475 [Burkholderiales bacterium]
MPSRSCRTSRYRLSAAVSSLLAALLLAAPVHAQTPAPAASAPTAATPAADPPKTDERIVFDRSWDAPEPWRTDRMYFQFAYYTWHFHYDPDHQQSYLADFEYRFDKTWLGGQWIGGFSLFQNSFGQFSQYVYGALQWRPWEEHPQAYVKVSAGLLHGYAGEYKNKIPFNDYGTAPAIIPSVGYCWNRYCGEFVLLGLNAALFTIGATIP